MESPKALHRIDPEYLWIGHAGDGQNVKIHCEQGIEAIVQLATEEPIPQLPREMLLFRVPILDGTGNEPARLGLAIELLSRLLILQTPTLVCCSAGASRSPAVAAFALAKSKGGSPLERLQQISQQHPTNVSPGLWTELLTCHEQN